MWKQLLGLFSFILPLAFGQNFDCIGDNVVPSPIDITYNFNTPQETHVPPLDFEIPSNLPMVFENTGLLLRGTIDQSKTSSKITVRGGGLTGTYRFAFMDFHWGSLQSNGSEHLKNGRRYDIELQMFFYNPKYGCSFDESQTVGAREEDVIAAFSILICQSGSKYNLAFNPILKELSNLATALSTADVTLPSLGGLLPTESDVFFKYQGSMTTDQCYEPITWFVFEETVPLALDQIEEFFQLTNSGGNVILNNFRTLMPRQGRVLTFVNSTYKTDPTCMTKPLQNDRKLPLANFIYKEAIATKNINGAMTYCINSNMDHATVFGLVRVGQLRYFNNQGFQTLTNGRGSNNGQFCSGPEFRVSAIKDSSQQWVEYQTGKPVPFYHFPSFDPSQGEVGDTLVWNAHKNKLQVVGAEATYPGLCFYVKKEIAKSCPEESSGRLCNDAGNCLDPSTCACDNGFSGDNCEFEPLDTTLEIGMLLSFISVAVPLQMLTLATSRSYFHSPTGVSTDLLGDARSSDFVFDRVVTCKTECNNYNPNTRKWDEIPIANFPVSPVVGFATTVIKDSAGNDKYWWATHETDSFVLQTDFSQGWTPFSALSEARSGHCMVQLDCDRVAVIGGIVGPVAKSNILVYNLLEEEWSDSGLTITRGETDLACGKITDCESNGYVVFGCGSLGTPMRVWDLKHDYIYDIGYDCNSLPGDLHLGFKNLGPSHLGLMKTTALNANSRSTHFYTFNINDGFTTIKDIFNLAYEKGSWFAIPSGDVCLKAEA